MVLLVNASVYGRCCSQTVLSWTIFDVGDDSRSLSDFYQCIIFQKAQSHTSTVVLASIIQLLGSKFHFSLMSSSLPSDIKNCNQNLLYDSYGSAPL